MKISAADLGPEATYKLMTGMVVPRPIAWISSVSEVGAVNLAPFSCYTIVSNKPPMVGVNIGRKAGVRKDTAVNIHKSGEFVVNIGDEALLQPVHLSAVEHPPEVSEADLLGLQVLPADVVKAPRIAAAPISLECRLHSITPYGSTGAEFFVGEIVMFHVREGLLKEGKIDTAQLRPICRLGGPNYATLGDIVTLSSIGQTPKSIIRSNGKAG